jgi:hypothetical protein
VSGYGLTHKLIPRKLERSFFVNYSSQTGELRIIDNRFLANWRTEQIVLLRINYSSQTGEQRIIDNDSSQTGEQRRS